VKAGGERGTQTMGVKKSGATKFCNLNVSRSNRIPEEIELGKPFTGVTTIRYLIGSRGFSLSNLFLEVEGSGNDDGSIEVRDLKTRKSTGRSDGGGGLGVWRG